MQEKVQACLLPQHLPFLSVGLYQALTDPLIRQDTKTVLRPHHTNVCGHAEQTLTSLAEASAAL